MTQQLILIRPKEQTMALLHDLQEKLGHPPDAIVSPLMEIQITGATLPKVMKTPFIFTSQNAVRIAVPIIAQRGPVICVGEKVAKLARDNGFDVLQTYETASELMNHGIQKGTYLRAEEVSIELNASGHLDEYTIYRQTPVPITIDALSAIQAGALVPVYSEYAANRLLESTGGQAAKSSVVCISEKVAAVLARGNFAQIYIAPMPTAVAMLNLIFKRL